MISTNSFSSYKWILFTALAVRLIAVIFSQGYGMHDDHYLVVEAGASWANGHDYNSWLPWSKGNYGIPQGHSFSYVGINFIYFWIMKMLGVVDPKIVMLFNRLLHALASLLVVWYGIKITEKLSNRANAVKVGWLLAVLWIMPFISVRNLVEVAAIPFLIIGVWHLVKKETTQQFLFAGLLIGMAVSFRYQIGVFAIGVAAYYFFSKKFALFFSFCAGILLMFTLTQGVVDFFVWGRPFTELWEYVTYNMTEGTQYLPNQNYAMYFLVLMGCLLFPLGLLMGIGFFKTYKKHALIFIPTLVFILFHTIYPNRQERFILSVLPFFVILGVIGYDMLKDSQWKQRIWKGSMVAFWVLNIPLLMLASTTYTKKSRVEAMYHLYKKGYKQRRFLLEGSSSENVSMLPLFYANNWDAKEAERISPSQPLIIKKYANYDFIFFFDEKDLSKRIKQYKAIYPNMELSMKSYPSMIDVVLRKMNRHNANEYIEVWKTNSAK